MNTVQPFSTDSISLNALSRLAAASGITPASNPTAGSSNPLLFTGNGSIKLTDADTDQASFSLYEQPIAANQGLSVSFDFFAYGGTGADGITFFLMDASKPAPTVGAYGGALGYTQRYLESSGLAIPGLTHGYLGIGFDAYGNFSNPTEGRVGGREFTPDAVVIRGSEATNYAYLTGNTVPFSLDSPGEGATREDALRKAQIDLTSAGLLTVTVQADLNKDGDFADLNETVKPIDAFNVVAANGALPSTVKLGFAGATGSKTNLHEISLREVRGTRPTSNPDPQNPDPENPGSNPGNGLPDPDSDGGGESHCKSGVTLKGDRRSNTISGETGSDRIWGMGGDDRLSGQSCRDWLEGGKDNDKLWGGDGGDHLKGGHHHDGLFGENGSDRLSGGLGRDRLKGGQGKDWLGGGRGRDSLQGDQGDDALYGGRDEDQLKGGNGQDILRGNQGDDELEGGLNADRLYGGLGKDQIWGRWGNDRLWGGRGADELHGGGGRDRLSGGAQDDVLIGGAQADVLTGGEGSDRFVYRSAKDKGDRITDFDITQDVIDLKLLLSDRRYASTSFSDYVRHGQRGAHTVVSIDVDGDLAAGGFKTLVTLNNVVASRLSANQFVF